jgi:diguanylate cyclase (GGDEF)-like protein
MVIRRSLAWYLIGLIVLILALSSLTYFYIADRTEKNTLMTHEVSRDKDIRFVVQSLIDDEVDRLSSLIRSLREREDLIVEMAVSNPKDEFIGSIKNSMDRLARELSLDLFEATNSEGLIIYSVSTPTARNAFADYAIPSDNMQSTIRSEVARTADGWVVRAMVRVNIGNVNAGNMMVGTRIDNAFISSIARTTNSALTLGNERGVVASSLPTSARGHLDATAMARVLDHGLVLRRHRKDADVSVNYGPVRVIDRNFALVTEFDSSELVELNEERMRNHLRVFGSYTVMALILGAVLALRLVSPLVRLRKQAESTVEEIAGKTADLKGGDEIQSLVKSFDFMVDTIKDHLTEQRELEDSLRLAKQDWENTFNSITDMITIHDTDFNVIAANRSALENLKLDLNDIKEVRKCFMLYHGTSVPPAGCPSCESIKTGKPCINEVFEPHLNKYLEIRAIPRMDAKGEITGLIHVVRDISERKKMEDELTRQALYDALTRLPNRALFSDRLSNLFEHRRRHEELLFAVLFLDLDHFKRVNDTLGHVYGDKLLVTVAERLKECVRPGDTVSRFGGDEFVIILDELASEDDAIAVAERIMQRLGSPVVLGGSEIFVTASLGIAFSNLDYERPEHMLRDADNAMYHAKIRGRSQYAIFDDKMRHASMETMTLENDLRRAMDRSEFVLYYQPIINIETGLVSGFEALLRWANPVQGIMEPDMFLQAAEEFGLIVPIGDWVIEEACDQIRKWQERFPADQPLTMSVNISAKQFDHRLPEKVDAAIRKYAIRPGSLSLEVTEGVLMQNSDLAAELVSLLKEKGVHVYLDDFGTGYSSLRHIHTFSVDALKIDRSFVRNITEDREAREVVRAIASLAHNLDMIMIVEGVERDSQLEVFRSLECKYAQGFLFSEPRSPMKIEEYLQAHTKRIS